MLLVPISVKICREISTLSMEIESSFQPWREKKWAATSSSFYFHFVEKNAGHNQKNKL